MYIRLCSISFIFSPLSTLLLTLAQAAVSSPPTIPWAASIPHNWSVHSSLIGMQFVFNLTNPIRACAIGDLLTHIPFENCANFFGEYIPRSRSTDSQICVNLIQQSTPMASRVATAKWAVGTGSYGPTTMATLSNIQFLKKIVPIRWVQSLFPISILKHISLILTSLVISSYIH